MTYEKDVRLFFGACEVRRGGGNEKYLLRHGGGGPPTSLAAPSLTQTLNVMSSGMATNYAQPLTHDISTTNVMTLPGDYYLQFDPLLANGKPV